ncbi:MAG: hypothetical protein OEV31_00635 [Gammaproteobacteria bacterium]|nr:hypothetical protein [Gammaproteobacteria bacterium]
MAGPFLALGGGGCDFRPSAPESRAEYFVEKFILKPAAHDDLRAVAALGETDSPESLLTELPVRTAVIYLRARAQAGVSLGFHVSGSYPVDDDHKTVDVVVSEDTVLTLEPVRFRVDMTRRDKNWWVTRLQSD